MKTNKKVIQSIILGTVVVLMVLGPAGVAHAEVFNVDNTADTVDFDPGDGLCEDGSGTCTLRAAIMEANLLAGLDEITLPAGMYSLAPSGAGEDGSATGDLDITDHLTITGAGSAVTIIDGALADRVFHIHPGTTVHLTDLTVQNGSATDAGGGILNEVGTLTLINSTVSGNTSAFGGGGIANAFGTVTLRNSTISGNTGAFIGGGGILNLTGLSFTLINSTVSGNTATDLAPSFPGLPDGGGGGIHNLLGLLSLFNTTVSNNTVAAVGFGGGIFNLAPADFGNTIIANNLDGVVNPDDFGNPSNCSLLFPIDSFGFNLDSDGTCMLMHLMDLLPQPALLDPLGDNGGPTETHALLEFSPAIDAGDPLGCVDPLDGLLTTDQRGKPRPETAGGMCDIGAFEVQAAAVPLDHFLSYQIRPSKRARNHDHDGDDDDDDDDDDHGHRHEKRVVSLEDQFGKGTFRVVKPVALLNPADKNDGGINDEITHLMSYKVEGRRNHRPRVRNIEVTNQFTEQSGVPFVVDLVKADRLLVPASKSRDVKPAGPFMDNSNVDHFLCYRVRTSKHTPRFPRDIQVSVEDQFNQAPKMFHVKRPTRLCTPVDKEGEGIKNPDDHLMCYSVKPAKGQPKHHRIKGLWVNDQFGSMQVDTHREEELCLPSMKMVPPDVEKDEHRGDRRGRDHDDDHDDDKKANGRDHDDDDDHGDDHKGGNSHNNNKANGHDDDDDHDDKKKNKKNKKDD